MTTTGDTKIRAVRQSSWQRVYLSERMTLYICDHFGRRIYEIEPDVNDRNQPILTFYRLNVTNHRRRTPIMHLNINKVRVVMRYLPVLINTASRKAAERQGDSS